MLRLAPAFLLSPSTSALLQHLQTPVQIPHPCRRLWLRTCSEHPVQCLLTLVSVFPSLPVHSHHLLPAPSHNSPVSSSTAPDACWHSSSHPLSQHKGCSQRFVIPSTVGPPCFHRKGEHSPAQMFFTPTAMGSVLLCITHLSQPSGTEPRRAMEGNGTFGSTPLLLSPPVPQGQESRTIQHSVSDVSHSLVMCHIRPGHS